MSMNSEFSFKDEKRTLKLLTICILIVTVIMSGVSLAGLLTPTSIYTSQALQESFKTNDLVNFIIGLPILLGSLWLAHRGRLLGVLFLPGAMMYVVYNYIAYMVAMPVNGIYLLYTFLVLSSLFVCFYLIKHVDKTSIKQRLAGHIHEKLSGGFLVVFGVVFLFRALNILANPILRNIELPVTDLSILIADIVLSSTWITSGVLLWQRKALGYVSGGALLFQGVTLFAGLILVLVLNPLLTEAPFDLAGVLIVFVMSVICNIPFGLFVRGVRRTK